MALLRPWRWRHRLHPVAPSHPPLCPHPAREQETEQHLEELRQQLRDVERTIARQTAALEDNVRTLQSQVAREESKLAGLEPRDMFACVAVCAVRGVLYRAVLLSARHAGFVSVCVCVLVFGCEWDGYVVHVVGGMAWSLGPSPLWCCCGARGVRAFPRADGSSVFVGVPECPTRGCVFLLPVARAKATRAVWPC